MEISVDADQQHDNSCTYVVELLESITIINLLVSKELQEKIDFIFICGSEVVFSVSSHHLVLKTSMMD